MSFLIRVPATSANLGPGFDCLGLALDLWNEIEVEITGDHLQIIVEGEGKSSVPANQNNAIFKAMKTYADQYHRSLPSGIKLHCRNYIPLGAGLGSSAAAAVGGILAASAILELAEDQNDQLNCATQIEGHPDNVAPCLLGGLVSAVIENGQVTARNLPITPLSLVIVVPDFHFPTKASRATLPEKVSRQDVIFNLSRLVCLTDALAKGDLELLPVAMQDRIHQPYRIPLIPGASAAMSAAREAGAAAVVLSGAGPSLLAVLRNASDQKNVSNSMIESFKQAGLSASVLIPGISFNGASITSV